MKSISKAPKPPPTPILLPSIPSNTKPLNMTIDDGLDLTAHHNNNHHLLDWLEDSITFLPSFLDEPYTIPIEITSDEWWTPDLEQSHHVQTPATSTNLTDQTPNPQTQLSKKRKLPAFPRTSSDDDDEVQRKPAIGRKTYGKGINGGSSNGGSKESRWAEQLLNPCAAAIDAGNVSRVQHLIYVLHELSSPSGDPNHRLAAHGLRALALHLSSSGTAIGIPASPTVTSFSSSEPRLFRSSLIKFNEVSPWFAFPNSLANSSILQASASHRSRGIHVVDIGVSHGVQWPTLLEALTRRSGGAPPLVRLTVASAAPAPFSESPPGYDFSSHLLRYAKSIDLNLQIDRAETIGELELGEDETLIVCVQFRGGDGDELIRSVRGVDPDLVVMSEIEGGELREGGGFAAGFVRRAGLMWRFLESTSAAFKGRDCAERRLMEGEAAEMMAAEAAKGRRRERMAAAGFGEIGFGEEAVDAGRALLRKYDGNWEMRPPAKYPATAADEAVGLWWKGQPVSCCSLWKPIKESGAVGVGTS